MTPNGWCRTVASTQPFDSRTGKGRRSSPCRHGSIFATPVDGREEVWTSLRTAGGITDTLSFTHELTEPGRSYFEWELDALAQRFDGVTVLTFDGSGLIVNVALHHRPLGGVLAFSAEMGRRLGNSLGPGVFYQAPRAVDGQ